MTVVPFTQPVLGLFLLLVCGARAADEVVPPEAYARANQGLLEQHVLPRYERLVAAMAGLTDAAASSCGSSSEQVELLRDRYHAAMDAWMAVQHLRFGPVELFMRAYRLYFWPQARGKVAQAVDELVAKTETPGAGELTGASVAVQGLPAVEYLLYGEGGLGGVDAGNPDTICKLLTAVAGNMHGMAEDVVVDWRVGEVEYERSFLQPGPDNTYYKTPADATRDLFKSLHGGLQLIADVKLMPVVGEGIDTARPGMVESRRSRRALRNIVVNLAALEALYIGENGPGLSNLVADHAELDALMRKAFRKTQETARGIEPPLDTAVVAKETRPQVEKLLTQVLALKQIVKSRVAAALGLAVGFNALDGD